MSIIGRFMWIAVRRQALWKIDTWAHWASYADSTIFSGNNRIGKGTYLKNTSLGRHTYVTGGRIVNTKIGAFCSVGPEVMIGGLFSHPTDLISTHPIFYSSRRQSGRTFVSQAEPEQLMGVRIGNDVWIGARALVLDGVSIGDGAIVGAGAIVVEDVPPYSIVGGVPARVIRYRLSKDVVEALMKWKWWDLPDNVLQQLSADFRGHHKLSVDLIKALQDSADKLLGILKQA